MKTNTSARFTLWVNRFIALFPAVIMIFLSFILRVHKDVLAASLELRKERVLTI